MTPSPRILLGKRLTAVLAVTQKRDHLNHNEPTERVASYPEDIDNQLQHDYDSEQDAEGETDHEDYEDYEDAEGETDSELDAEGETDHEDEALNETELAD
ncbi:hypothetical protein CPC08DRAFT_767397 [Agrocybe pediades]|nr:hypothetical protein CPC08DRAFT_767397 [Agrocybe pediades]